MGGSNDKVLRVIERMLDAEANAWDSYNTRAMAVASLSALTASLVIGLGENATFERTPITSLLFGLASLGLVSALVCSLISLWPRQLKGQADSRDELLNLIVAARPDPPAEFEARYLDAAIDWVAENSQAVAAKRVWTKRAYLSLVAGIGFLAIQGMIVSLQRAAG